MVQTGPDSRLWSGAKRSRVDNYVRLASHMARLLVLVGGLMLAFQVCLRWRVAPLPGV